MKTILALLCIASLAGCAQDPPPEPVVVSVRPEPPHVAPECTSPDKRWLDLPDRDVTRAEGARNYAENRRRFGDLVDKRSVCRASIRAQSAPSPSS